jgi:uncharacterized repeat protein (TIGR03803 family)
VVRSPWTAADALVGLSRLSKALVLRTKERVQGTRAHQGVRAPLTSGDGTAGFGVVYKLDTAGNETPLYFFPLDSNNHGADGQFPYAPLMRDAAGNLYGTTFRGGPYQNGTVYKVNPSGNETLLHSFTGGADGGYPPAGLVMDAAGNLYGTAGFVVFKLVP